MLSKLKYKQKRRITRRFDFSVVLLVAVLLDLSLQMPYAEWRLPTQFGKARISLFAIQLQLTQICIALTASDGFSALKTELPATTIVAPASLHF